MDRIDLPSHISWDLSREKKERIINAYRAPWWRKAYWYFRLLQVRWNRWKRK